MLFGRRFKDRVPSGIDRNRPLKKGVFKDSHRQFRWKYTGYLLATTIGTLFLFLGVTVSNFIQNYQIFKKLAFDLNPQLVLHLEREVTWFLIFLAVSVVAIASLTFLIGFKMTTSILRPLIHMERHMTKVINGDWGSEDFRFSKAEDLTDLYGTYSYLYRSLRAQAQMELKLLEKLVIDPNNRETITTWKQLVNMKKTQLNLREKIEPIVGNEPKISEFADSRRAS